MLVLAVLCLALMPFVVSAQQGTAHPFNVLQVSLVGAITPASEDLLNAALATAESDNMQAVLLVLDTPGGLVTSMRGMVSAMLNAHVPVLVWVGPSGARATSAGVFLVAASHVAAMSPQSTIGAASPVGMGGADIGKTMQTKVKNELQSYVRGLAASRGRNAQWYEKAVDQAVSLTAQEAAISNVVDVIADSPEEFLQQLATRGIPFRGRIHMFSSQDVVFKAHDPGFRYSILSWLLNPQVAYLLLLVGIAGLFLEFVTPGVLLPGVFGGLSLLLALYALSILPTSTTGILLILFAVVLFVLEIFITSFGLLGLAALTSLFIGSLLLIRPTPGIDAIPLATVLITVSGLAVILGCCVVLITKAQRGRKAFGAQALVGETVRVTKWEDASGKIFVRGEMWRAISADKSTFSPGDMVLVTSADGLTLTVSAIPRNEESLAKFE